MNAKMRLGYKLTELGLIPEDWNVDAFRGIYAEPSRNGVYKTAEFHGRGTRIVNMGEMFGLDFISDQEMSRVSLTPKEIAIAGLRDGDLLFGRRSVVPAGAGKCSLVVDPIEPLIFESSIIRVRLNKSEANPLFYYYFFASTTGRSVMSVIVSGTNVKGIRGSELRDLRIPSPPHAEQCAIAATLSDMDALISGLNRLIAKKRDIKQAAMQQLLTGQQRLPGFSGKWEVKRLGEIANLYQPVTISAKQFTDSGYPVYGANGVVGFFSEFNHDKCQVTVTCRGSTCGTVNRTVEKSWITGNAMVVNCDQSNSINKDFLYFMLLGQNLSICITGSGQPQIVRGPLANFELSIPSDLEEQTAITTILSDMDAELASLEDRRNKTHQLKQGMMQELLTGRIRLK